MICDKPPVAMKLSGDEPETDQNNNPNESLPAFCLDPGNYKVADRAVEHHGCLFGNV